MTMEMAGGGTLHMWEDGGRIFFRCESELKRDGLYKVWIRGSGGEMLLGTLTPAGEKLSLYRALTPLELRRYGCWPIQSARCVMVYAFRGDKQRDDWTLEDNPGRLVNEETRKFGEWRRMLCRKKEDWLELAYPVRKDAALPLSHLFCLAVPMRIHGEMCLVWRFNREGEPYLPTK